MTSQLGSAATLVAAMQQTELANAYKRIRELESTNKRLRALNNEHEAIISGLQDYIKQQERRIEELEKLQHETTAYNMRNDVWFRRFG